MLDLEKDDLNIVGGHCGFLTYPNSMFLSNLTTILKIALLIPYMCPWFWRKQNRTSYKRIVFLCFGAFGNSWRADAPLLCLTQNFLSIEKRLSREYFSTLLKGNRTSQCYFHWIIIKSYYLHNFSFPQVSSFPINLQYYRNWQRDPWKWSFSNMSKQNRFYFIFTLWIPEAKY